MSGEINPTPPTSAVASETAPAPVVHDTKITPNSVEVGYTESDPFGPQPQPEENLLAGKFKSAEELEKAYKELESKLGKSPEDHQDAKEPEENVGPKVAAVEHTQEAADMLKEKGLDISSFTREFESTGQLSEESYQTLETKGITRDMVNAYIDGQRVLVDSQVNEVKQSIGGEIEYKKLMEWANTTLTDREKQSYDMVLATNNLDIIKLAAQGLKARYTEVMGKDPAVVVGGSTAGGNDGRERFASRAEMVRAMQDPRYAVDPAYRARVERKVINSNI